VRFRFLQRPEYVTGGTRFVFREGRTKGIGVVLNNQHDAPPISGGDGSGASARRDSEEGQDQGGAGSRRASIEEAR
jgi:hypothetical protein